MARMYRRKRVTRMGALSAGVKAAPRQSSEMVPSLPRAKLSLRLAFIRNLFSAPHYAIEPSLRSLSPENGSFCGFGRRLLPKCHASFANLGVQRPAFAEMPCEFCQFGSSETGTELQKPANSGLFCPLRGRASALGTGWLGREGSNFRMVESKNLSLSFCETQTATILPRIDWHSNPNGALLW
jgi:hypothetical protein